MPLIVQRTRELVRIATLPRRDALTYYASAVDRLTAILARPGGTMRLLPQQAAALMDLRRYGGAWAPLPVGSGKTLISYLAPTIIGAKRPLLVTFKSLFDKTVRDYKDYYIHWRGPAPRTIEMLSYEQLSRVSAANFLERYRPDLVVFDESHALKNPKAARTKRVKRFRKAFPDIPFVLMTGTAMDRTHADYVHTLQWCLPEELVPFPKSYPEQQLWLGALDPVTRPDKEPVDPGALRDLCTTDEQRKRFDRGGEDRVDAACEAYRERLLATPGVVYSPGGECNSSILLDELRVPEDPAIDKAFERLRVDKERPDGWSFSDMKMGAAGWRHARELGLGLYYRWDPEPPVEWLDARREWAAVCRDILENNRRNLDSPLQVSNAIDQGHYSYAKVYLEDWRQIKQTFKPNTVPVWVSDSVLNLVDEWMRHHTAIVWASHRYFIAALQARGWPCYCAGAVDQWGRPIKEARPEGGSIVAAIGSCSTGQNLQAWDHSLVVAAPSSGQAWEQMIGRTHRQGQRADVVRVTLLSACYEYHESLEKARYRSKLNTHKGMKLCYADIVARSSEELGAGYRWNK